jgi:hypothetical protein
MMQAIYRQDTKVETMKQEALKAEVERWAKLERIGSEGEMKGGHTHRAEANSFRDKETGLIKEAKRD